jgi:hypothetical protein
LKISELFEKKLEMPTSKGKTSGIIQSPNLSYLDAGIQTIAYLHSKFPDKVIKTVNISGVDDPAYQFLRICKNHQNNPYFPKIYAYKMYSNSYDEDDKDRFKQFRAVSGYQQQPPDWKDNILIVVIERLTGLKESESTAVSLFQQVGILPSDLTTLRYIDRTRPNNQGGVMPPLRAISRAFNTHERRLNIYKNTRDPQLKQAMKLMEPLFNNYIEDMHEGNVMLRLEPTPHLVFIDPVAPTH